LAHIDIGRIHTLAGRFAAAEESLATARAICEDIGEQLVLQRVMLQIAQTRHAHGHRQEAIAIVHETIARLAALSAPLHQRQAEELLVRIS
jgi:hypothetical protein